MGRGHRTNTNTRPIERVTIRPSGLEGLEGRHFDAVVVGGGVLGVGVARELQARGRSCLLVERHDYGWGTTARSTRLIHGGLRYLANYDFGLVREGLRERAWLLRTTPNLVAPLLFVLPVYDAPLWRRLRLRAGLGLYDVLAGRRGLPRHSIAPPCDVARLEPTLRRDGLQLAGLYWDAQVELAERMVIEVARGAEEAGAVLRNHVRADRLRTDQGLVTGLAVVAERGNDRAEVSTDLVVNASGPWADRVLEDMGIQREPILRLVQGAHLVYPRLGEHAVAFEHPDDGRLCFCVPWQHATLVGTTETDIPAIESERITPQEMEYLVRAAAFVYPDAARNDPWWCVTGVRALPRGAGDASRVTRRHVLIDHDVDGASGLWTAVGGKLTAWRSIAAEVVDDMGVPRTGRSNRIDMPAPGRKPDETGEPVGHRLWRLYGARAPEIRAYAERDPWWGEPLVPGPTAIRAEVVHAVEFEWGVSLADLVFRRLALGFGRDLGAQAADAIVEIGVQRLDWDADRVRSERLDYAAEVQQRRLP